MSELFNKDVNAQKERLKKLLGFTQAPVNTQKLCEENERNRHARKNIIDGRKHFM